jgi:hypothetical protein
LFLVFFCGVFGEWGEVGLFYKHVYFLLYSSVLMMTVDLICRPGLLLRKIYQVLFICYTMYSCLLCFGFWLLLVLILWFSIFVAIGRYVFCIFGSSTFMAVSVSVIILVRYDSSEGSSTLNGLKLLALIILRFERGSAYVQQNFAIFRLSELLTTTTSDKK